jgi:hypothetical protein
LLLKFPVPMPLSKTHSAHSTRSMSSRTNRRAFRGWLVSRRSWRGFLVPTRCGLSLLTSW